MAESGVHVGDLTFRNDPLLVSDGITCNRLLSESREGIFLRHNVLNLYAALVKPSDFTSETTSVQYPLFKRTPWINVSPSFVGDLIESQETSLLHDQLSRMVIDYSDRQFKSDFKKIKYRLKNEILSGNVSLIVGRLLARELSKEAKGDERTILSDILAETNSIGFLNSQMVKLPLKFRELIPPSVVYLIGYLSADGCIGADGEISFSDGNPDVSKLGYSKEHLENISALFSSIFRVEVLSVSKAKRYYYRFIFRNKSIARFLNFFFGCPFGVKYDRLEEPRIFSLLPRTQRTFLRNIFWRGYVDGDGNVSKNSIRVGAKNQEFLKSFYRLLRDQGFQPSISRRKTQNVLTIHFFDLMRYAEHVGISHPCKQIDLLGSLMKDPNKWLCYGIRKRSLTSHGFFDLSALGLDKNDLKIVGAGTFLKLSRQGLGLSQEALARKLGVSPSSVSYWERNIKSCPFRVMRRVAEGVEADFYTALEKLDIRWRFKNSRAIKLPLRPSKELNSLVKYLSPLHSARAYAKKVYVVRGFGDGKLSDSELRKILDIFCRIFDLRVIKSNGRNYYVHNRVLQRFLSSCYQFKRPWGKINSSQVSNFVKKWRIQR